MPPKRPLVNSRGRWQTPRHPAPPTPPGSGEGRGINLVRTLWGAGVAICTAISGIVTFVFFINADRQKRLEAIETGVRTLYEAPDASRNAVFSALEREDLAEHLEPYAIRGLQGFIQDRTTAASPACATASATTAPHALPREEVSRAFRLIASLQAPNHTRHSYPDRVIDNFLIWWHGQPDPVPLPFALDGKDLRGVSFRHVKLTSASFVGACLSGADFNATLLDSARLDSAVLDRARFTQASMRSASLVGIRSDSINFDHSDLTDAKLNQATLTHARFFDADLSCATLGDAVLDGAYFSTATLRWTYLGGAQLAHSQQWDEVRTFTGAYVGGARGLPALETSLAHKGGAVPDTMNAIRWSEAHTQQLAAGGLCARKR